jgi:hypothetical protein
MARFSPGVSHPCFRWHTEILVFHTPASDGTVCAPRGLNASLYVIKNNTGHVRVTQQWGAFLYPQFPFKRNECNTLRVCFYSLSYPACKQRFVVRGHSDSTIFFHIISQTARHPKKKLLNLIRKCFIFSTTFLSNLSYFKQNSKRRYHKCTEVFI